MGSGWQGMLVSALLGLAGEILRYILGRLRDRRLFERALRLAELHVARLDGDDTLDKKLKRERVADALTQDLKAVGIELTDSLINLAVELAVNRLRRTQGKPGEVAAGSGEG